MSGKSLNYCLVFHIIIYMYVGTSCVQLHASILCVSRKRTATKDYNL